jgi:hypothetical protein
MTKVVQLIVPILWVVIGPFAFSEVAIACSCPIPTIEKRFVHSDYVFTAKVVGTSTKSKSKLAVGEKEKTIVSYPGMHGIMIEFEALRDYKGSSSE